MIAQMVTTMILLRRRFSLTGMWSRLIHFVLMPLGVGIATALALRYGFRSSATRPGYWLVVRGGPLFAGGRYHLRRRGRGFAGRPPRRGLLAGSPRHRQSLPAPQGDLRNVRNCRHREPPRQRGRTGGNLATDEPGRASRTLWRGKLVQREPQSGVRPSSAGNHRSRRRGLSADGFRRRPPCDRVQWRDLQFPRTAARARGAGGDFPQPVRHGGHSGRMASVAGRHADALQRNVGAGDLRHPDRRIVSGARPLRHQAAIVCDDIGALCLCIRAARIGAKRPDQRVAGYRRGATAHARCLRGRGQRADPLPGGAPPAGRSLHVAAPGKGGNPALVADGGSSAGDPEHRSRTRGALSRAFPGCRRASDAQRRADRDLPVGRVRFVGRDLHHGRARKGRHGSAGQHLVAPRLRRDVPRRLQRRAADGRGGRGLGGCCADIPRDRPRRRVDRARSNSRRQ